MLIICQMCGTEIKIRGGEDIQVYIIISHKINVFTYLRNIFCSERIILRIIELPESYKMNVFVLKLDTLDSSYGHSK